MTWPVELWEPEGPTYKFGSKGKQWWKVTILDGSGYSWKVRDIFSWPKWRRK